MGTRTGKNGQLRVGASTLAEVTNITFTETSNNVDWASSSSGGYRQRNAGSKTLSGSFDFVLDTNNPMDVQFDVGDKATLLVDEDSTESPLRDWTLAIIIDSIDWNIPITDDGNVGGTVNFSNDGSWTRAGVP